MAYSLVNLGIYGLSRLCNDATYRLPLQDNRTNSEQQYGNIQLFKHRFNTYYTHTVFYVYISFEYKISKIRCFKIIICDLSINKNGSNGNTAGKVPL